MNYSDGKNEFPSLEWYKSNYQLSGISLSSEYQSDMIDKYLIKFSYKMKLLISKHGGIAEYAMSSFLLPTYEEFKEFLEENKD